MTDRKASAKAERQEQGRSGSFSAFRMTGKKGSISRRMGMHSGSRRRFLAAGGVLGAGGFAASVLPRTAWASPMGLPIGIQLYTVGKPLGEDAPGTLKQLHAIGYREVESAGLAKHTAKEFRGYLD